MRANEETIEDLWTKYVRTRRRAYKDRLVERYMPLVRSVAEQLALRLPRSVDEEDLKGAGVFGLFKAVENFDPERNVKFETYCRLRVRGSMIDHLRQQDWIPREARNRGSRLADVIEDMRGKLGRDPTDLEVARRLRLSLEALREALAELRFGSMVSLAAAESDGNGNENDHHEQLLVEDAEPAEILHRREMFQVISRELTAVERRLVRAYYFEGLTLKAIGEREGISESRVCQIHGRMLDRLAERLEDEA
ncbi:MAG TPA: FliA/WhiG family RNA polymerase sigma factor [Planctomycetota bacterium]|nr:FliA/WhiG family RNA polymerase sigma factor [Planctomycetota bacterium]